MIYLNLSELVETAVSALKVGAKWLLAIDHKEEAITASESLHAWVLDNFKDKSDIKSAIKQIETPYQSKEAEELLKKSLLGLLEKRKDLMEQLILLLMRMEAAGRAAGLEGFIKHTYTGVPPEKNYETSRPFFSPSPDDKNPPASQSAPSPDGNVAPLPKPSGFSIKKFLSNPKKKGFSYYDEDTEAKIEFEQEVKKISPYSPEENDEFDLEPEEIVRKTSASPQKKSPSPRIANKGATETNPAFLKLKKAFRQLDIPQPMKVAKTCRVKLTVAQQKEQLSTTKNTIDVKEIEIANQVKVTLVGEKFTIVSLNNNNQKLVTADQPTEWNWDVTPKESGLQKLAVIVSTIVAIPDEGNSEQEIKLSEETVKVLVNVPHSAVTLVKNYWQWAIGLVTGTGVLWKAIEYFFPGK